MGSNPTQAIAIVLMMIGFLLIGVFFAGGGFVALIGALALIGASCYFFLKCKPWEDQPSR